jgi:hypothetical protein
MAKSSSNFYRLCGLWKRKGKDGQTFLSGPLGNNSILIMPNKFKTEDKHPDYVLFLAPKRAPLGEGDTDREPGDEA